ncbi:tetratricopeptide repeat protein [Neptunicella sp. SCSIO 80796]|uniref:tetratricopeptide repeat protein n=1 Tax=Neptunicella plasticusilytica TaxID=3117012 RepID=UPI003A4DFEF5
MIIKGFLTIVTLLGLLLPAQADVTDDQKQIELCSLDPSACLEWSTNKLLTLQINSLKWNRVKQLQLNSLSTLQKFNWLKKELQPLVDRDDLPPVLKSTVLTYHAKMLAQEGKTDDAKHYLQSAIDLIKTINQASFSLMRYVDITNLQLYLHQYSQAESMLLELEQRYSHSQDAHFKLELYSNLGDLYRQTDQPDKQLDYLQKANKAALELGNKQQIAVANYNLGRALQRLGRIADAEKIYQQALELAQHAQFDNGIILVQLRLAEIKLAQQDTNTAKQILAQLNEQPIPTIHQPLYQQISSMLSKISN